VVDPKRIIGKNGGLRRRRDKRGRWPKKHSIQICHSLLCKTVVVSSNPAKVPLWSGSYIFSIAVHMYHQIAGCNRFAYTVKNIIFQNHPNQILMNNQNVCTYVYVGWFFIRIKNTLFRFVLWPFNFPLSYKNIAENLTVIRKTFQPKI
jgi:hypothetical protein